MGVSTVLRRKGGEHNAGRVDFDGGEGRGVLATVSMWESK